MVANREVPNIDCLLTVVLGLNPAHFIMTLRAAVFVKVEK